MSLVRSQSDLPPDDRSPMPQKTHGSWSRRVRLRGSVGQRNGHDRGKAGIRHFGNFSSDPIGAPEKPIG
jgi:hypothetical protein